jgi:predicted esterase
MKKNFLLLACCILLNVACQKNMNTQKSENLEEWLSKGVSQREPLEQLDFATKPLSAKEAEDATILLLKDHQNAFLSSYESEWEKRLLTLNELQMPFYYQIFGDEPADGRSLFISLHGGGGTTPETNDQQYENQKHLYDAAMQNREGVYLAPRAPTNTWNLWHQEHIDEFLKRIIQLATQKLNVNPNKVYILGYSAGGDGVYQLAPRMADRWAAASMMAGHPNDASPLSLRNTPFSLHMGALDDAYDRNAVARKWGDTLDSLQSQDPGGYIHHVELHEGRGHWMQLEDSVALSWMPRFTRNPIPEKIVWKQDDRKHQQFYWLGMPEQSSPEETSVIVSYNKQENEINILQNPQDTLHIFLRDQMLNLDLPVTINYRGQTIYQDTPARTILSIYQTINAKGDQHLTFPVVLTIVHNSEVR